MKIEKDSGRHYVPAQSTIDHFLSRPFEVHPAFQSKVIIVFWSQMKLWISLKAYDVKLLFIG